MLTKIIGRIAILVFFIGVISGSASATNWYVDPAASGSSNGTSWTNAWKSFSSISWSSIKPGDTLYLSGGSTSQTYTTALTVGASGTSGNPITIAAGQDAGHTGRVIFDGGGGTTTLLSIGSHPWVTINGNYNGAQNILFQNNSSSVESVMVSCAGSQSSLLAGIVIEYVEINPGADGITCSWVGGSTTNAFVLAHSYIHGINWDHAVAVNGSDLGNPDSPAYSAGAVFHDNTILVNNNGTDNGCGPDAIAGTNGITVYNNVVEGVSGITSQGFAYCSHQDLVQSGGTYYLVYNNFFSGGANSVSESDWPETGTNAVCGHHRFYDNVMQQSSTQPHSHGIEMDAHSGCASITDFWVQNNTWVDFWGYMAVNLIVDTSSISMNNSGITNNIFFNTGQQDLWTIGNGVYSCGTDYVIDHNNVNVGSQGGTKGTCNGSTYNGTNNYTGNPDFTSYTEYNLNNNYHLQSGSTSDIGTALNLSSYFTTDKDGNPRPATGNWDMGAYVYNSAGVPVPPTGLSLTVQ